MPLRDFVIQSQLVPPSLRKGLRHRPRLTTRLTAAYEYPLTILQAGTGHSKTTTLAAFARGTDPVFWFTITESDRDPLLFLAQLFSAFNQQGFAYGADALTALEERSSSAPAIITLAVLNPLLNALTAGLSRPALLILDDYHLVADVPEINALVERLVDYLPPALHVILSTRQMPQFGALTRWRAKNQVMLLQRADLAFTLEEIQSLFREEYGLPVTDAQVCALEEETEGWAIALQMIWQRLQSSGEPAVHMVSRLDDVLSHLPETLEGLFDYLAEEVLNRQPEPTRRFLLTTSVLRELTGPACDALLGETPGTGEQTLNQLHNQGLFLSSINNQNYRYQHLFRDFLTVQLKRRLVDPLALHRKAAIFFEQAGQPEETLYHLLEAGDYPSAAQKIMRIGPQLVTQGRLESLVGWIQRIPAGVVERTPELQVLLGDANRLRSRFDEALEFYAAAEKLFSARGERLGQARALRGQAQIYLDTIRPIKADILLQAALRLLDPILQRLEVADLLEQLAENQLNFGNPDQAVAYHREAAGLRAADAPSAAFLEERAMLRTGRLLQARTLLETRASREDADSPARPQRFHREIPALLSLIHSLLGEADLSEKYAREGIAVGARLESAFVEAVGYMRLGHALLLKSLRPWHAARRAEAIAAYQHAIEIVSPFRVTRVIVEPLWGLCRAYGLEGNLAQAESYARQALEIAEQSGDGWIANLVRVSMGASLVLQGMDGEPWLDEARRGFEAVRDPHSACAALVWMALNHSRQERPAAAVATLAEALQIAETHGYEHLLTRISHLGLVDDQSLLPLLLALRADPAQGGAAFPVNLGYIDHLLAQADCDPGLAHPGYSLAVRTLGPFAVWRGGSLIKAQDWQREKARQLFLLLITERGRWMTREQIADRLWPYLDAGAAVRDFKSALNALNHALEPTRPHGDQPFFIQRRDALYGLNPKARISIDLDDFQSLISRDDPAEIRAGLDLYEQDYLLETCLEDWAEPQRELLRSVYLQAADRFGAELYRQQHYEEALAVCQSTLARDRCWEPAYRLMMQVYAALGNRAQIRALYNRLSAVLLEELGVPPSPETATLADRLLKA